MNAYWMEVGHAGGSAGASLAPRQGSRALLGGKIVSGHWRVGTRPVHVSVDGVTERTIEIGMSTVYTLFDSTDYSEHLLEFECVTPGL
jgi:hypothetical protein